MVNSNLIKSSVGCLIYAKSTGRYLFLLRDGQKYGGTWGLVGGKVENDEIASTALYREAMEETGVDLRSMKTIPIETFTSDNRRFVYHTFLISVEDEFVPRLNAEHRGWCWVELKDHPRPLHPGVWRTFKFKSIVEKISTIESVL